MKRRVLLAVVVLVAIASGTAYLKMSNRAHDLVLTGMVTTNDVIVSSQIQGQLGQLLVKEGDAVKGGQLVAVIEPHELRADEAFYARSEEGAAAQVQEAEAGLKYQEAQTRDQIRQAEAALAATEAQQAEATANLEQARLDYERTDGLFKQSVASAQALDQARTTYAAQKAHLESLRKQVEAQRAAVALARSNSGAGRGAAQPAYRGRTSVGRRGGSKEASPGSTKLHGNSSSYRRRDRGSGGAPR